MEIPDNRDKEGEWNKYRNGNNEVMYSCSECDIQSKVGYWYCPGCGAKMKFPIWSK